MDEQALLDEFDDLMTFLEDDLGRPLTEDETSQIIEYVFDDEDGNDIDTEIVPVANGEYTFSGEDCPKCGASMEGDSYTGTCNGCGHKWGTPAEPEPTIGDVVNAFCATGEGGGVDPSCTMYHGTSPEKAAKIRADGKLKAGGGIEGADIYLTKNPEYAKMYGSEVFEVKVPQSKLEKVDFDFDPDDPDEVEQMEYAAEYTYKGPELDIVADAVKQGVSTRR